VKAILFQNLSDEQVICTSHVNNEQIVSELYKRYFNKIAAKCYGYCNNTDDSLDLAQEVLLLAFNKLDTFKGTAKFSTWLHSITHNYCVSWLQKSKRLQFESFEKTNIEYGYSEENETNETELNLIMLEKYLNEITEEEKKIIVLKYENKLSVRELQVQLNLSPSAVKMRLMRARKKLESCFNCA